MKHVGLNNGYLQFQVQTMGKVKRGKSAYMPRDKAQQQPKTFKHKRPEGGVSNGATNSNQDNSR
jgi:hypothetical protein